MDWVAPLIAAVLAIVALKLIEVVFQNSGTFGNRRVALISDRYMDSLRERAIDAELEREQEKQRADKLQEINSQLRIEQAILQATVDRLQLEIQALEWRIKDLEEQSGLHDIPNLGDG